VSQAVLKPTEKPLLDEYIPKFIRVLERKLEETKNAET